MSIVCNVEPSTEKYLNSVIAVATIIYLEIPRAWMNDGPNLPVGLLVAEVSESCLNTQGIPYVDPVRVMGL